MTTIFWPKTPPHLSLRTAVGPSVKNKHDPGDAENFFLIEPIHLLVHGPTKSLHGPLGSQV